MITNSHGFTENNTKYVSALLAQNAEFSNATTGDLHSQRILKTSLKITGL